MCICFGLQWLCDMELSRCMAYIHIIFHVCLFIPLPYYVCFCFHINRNKIIIYTYIILKSLSIYFNNIWKFKILKIENKIQYVGGGWERESVSTSYMHNAYIKEIKCKLNLRYSSECANSFARNWIGTYRCRSLWGKCMESTLMPFHHRPAHQRAPIYHCEGKNIWKF